LLGSLLLHAIATLAVDWPQFHGPRRDNLSTETGLLERWPDGGPKLIWQADGLGEGYATVAICAGKIYTAGNLGPDTVITALDLDGKTLWRGKNGPAYQRAQPGARATPTIDDGKLYHLNADGDVICLEAATGQKVWTRNILADFNGRNSQWALSESLLVDGNHVIACPGGTNVMMVACDKQTGQTVWTCTGVGDKPGYTSPLLITYGGLRQIVTLTSNNAIGVAANSGTLLWKYAHPAPYGVNASQPVYHDGHLALFGTWGRGATLLRLTVNGDRCTVAEVWRTPELDNEHGGSLRAGDYLYGQADGNHKRRHWACLDWQTGQTMYADDSLATERSGTLTYADGLLYLLTDKGTVALQRPNPRRFEIVSQFDLPKQGQGPYWAHPVICDGRLYLRHDQHLYAYDVRRTRQ
jgi:outer membrane protein assembly factor BamB